MAKGKKTGGRTAGTPNKTTKVAKDVILEASERLGGVDRLVTWAQEEPKNEHAFWSSIYPKLLPLQVNGAGPDGEHVIQSIQVNLVKADAAKG